MSRKNLKINMKNNCLILIRNLKLINRIQQQNKNNKPNIMNKKYKIYQIKILKIQKIKMNKFILWKINQLYLQKKNKIGYLNQFNYKMIMNRCKNN